MCDTQPWRCNEKKCFLDLSPLPFATLVCALLYFSARRDHSGQPISARLIMTHAQGNYSWGNSETPRNRWAFILRNKKQKPGAPCFSPKRNLFLCFLGKQKQETEVWTRLNCSSKSKPSWIFLKFSRRRRPKHSVFRVKVKKHTSRLPWPVVFEAFPPCAESSASDSH